MCKTKWTFMESTIQQPLHGHENKILLHFFNEIVYSIKIQISTSTTIKDSVDLKSELEA